jgi:glucose-6-phosphate 1-epimerase
MNSQFITKQTVNSSVFYQINHPNFCARIAEFGAQLLSFTPTGKQDVLWLSKQAQLDGSKAIRGGAPLCWPWFGPAQAEYIGEPQHGYVRTLTWSLKSFVETDSSIELIMKANLAKELIDSLGLGLQVRYVLGDNIEIELTTTNLSNKPKPLSQAIHTYFALDDVNDHTLLGLNKVSYIDQLDDSKQKIQNGEVVITEHTDRVYLTSQDNVTLLNTKQQVDIVGVGHDSIVVWNPWQDVAKNMGDFDDNGYKNMICVEMANTQGLVLAPNSQYTLTQKINARDKSRHL